MLRGLLRLTWIEIKVFFREPLGAIGTVVMPVLVFVLLGRLGTGMAPESRFASSSAFKVDVPVFAAILISLNAVLSLVAIIAIYREGGILKRLRATPLRATTILTAHVLVKLLFTAATLALTILAGQRYYPIGADVPLFSFGVALIISTWSILAVGFVIASIVPTARFAQPVGALVLYPMLGLSGLFVPQNAMSPTLQNISSVLPLTYSVSLLRGIWKGDAWSAHMGDVGALVLVFLICVAVSSRVFRWE
ncbi:MAG TPA: ABC transporter permease [Gemmatimonadaceae bacterium]|jgi:ABC-2 type transport system permease protein